MITIMAMDFYYGRNGIAEQICILEAKNPGITMQRPNTLGRVFLDHFPLSAFCLVLTFVRFHINSILYAYFVFRSYRFCKKHPIC